VAVAIVGGSLAGCARDVLASQQAPAADLSSLATTPAPTPGSDSTSLPGIQGDLDSANSATTNAGGDVADADSSAATNDSP
jgi:hypothetical protein